MARPYQILMPLFSLFLVRVDLTDLIPLKLTVEMIKIYDGDTLLVKHGGTLLKVRLSRIDSPEKRQPFIKRKGDAGAYSQKCLVKLVKQERKLILKIEKKDIYGRILGEVNDLSFKMIHAGCSTLYPYAQFSTEKEKYMYLQALKKAKASKRGLWQYGGFMQPKMWRSFSKRSGGRR